MQALRFLPLLVLASLLGLALASGARAELSWASLAANRQTLVAFVAAHRALASLAYIGLYVAVIAVSIPGAEVMTISGGLLFGTWLGGALAAIAATLGSSLLFLAVRAALAPSVAAGAGARLERFRPLLERHAFRGVLTLRLIPLLPFWLVDLVPALLGIRYLPFVAGTALGILPATFIYAGLGAGAGELLGQGRAPDFGVILTPRILVPLLGLAALAAASAFFVRRA
jgi:uncharacterized membrane protein YdjX (TVP38/TMEM64 family)